MKREVKIKAAEALGWSAGYLAIGTAATIIVPRHRKAFAIGATLGSAISALRHKDGDLLDRVIWGAAGGFMVQSIVRSISLSGAFEGLGFACVECSKYPNGGLRHSLKHLQEIFPKAIFMPLTQQAQYADAVTRDKVNDADFIASFLTPIDGRPWNTTSIGNLAYIATYSRFKPAREYASGLLDLFKRYKSGKL